MHYLDESHLLLFLVQVFLILGLARGLGLLLSAFRQPSITGEILVGVILGPTLLGRLAPGLHAALFPNDPVQTAMLESLAWFGILFFLLVTGLETDFGTAWRQRKDALILALSDLILPFLIAFVPCMLLSDRYLVDPGARVMFSVFVATIMTISALPVTARVLQDLGLYRTDLGLLIMCALTINDVAGWVTFAIILGLATGSGGGIESAAYIVGATLTFAAVSFTLGRRFANRLVELIYRYRLPEPGSSLTLVCLLGLLGGVVTLRIGIHGLFGFFVAGIVMGECRALPESTRQVITQMVRAVLVPIFFATIGLRLDFAAGFDAFLALFLLAIGIGGRFAGAWMGVTRNRRSDTENRYIIAIGHVPGGEMQVVISMIALEYGVITEAVFVAIVFGAVATCVIVGPWMQWVIQRSKKPSALRYFSERGLVADLRAENKLDAIRELCRAAAPITGLDGGLLAEAAIARESAMGTALGEGVAVPHARLSDLRWPLVVVGRSPEGIDWNAPDAKPAHLLFLILTPREDESTQVKILAAIAGIMRSGENRGALRAAQSPAEMWGTIRHLFAQKPASAAPGG